MKKNILNVVAVILIIVLTSCTINVNGSSSDSPETIPGSGPIETGSGSLTGRLLYTVFFYDTVSAQNDTPTTQIKVLDLATGDNQVIFNVTGNAWIYSLAVSPDGGELLISYTPPYEQGDEVHTSIFTAPLGQPESMQILFDPPKPSDRYTQAGWSLDGNSIYYVRSNYWERAEDEIFPHYKIFRMAYPDGESEEIIDQGFWPRLSPDGSKLVYVALDAVSGDNKLMISHSDGSNPQEISLTGLPSNKIYDTPVFTPDGQSILFSAPVAVQSYKPNVLDTLFGVDLVEAHSVPSDWWSVSVSGGPVKRLTHLQTIKLIGSMSPDGQHIASLSSDGIFVMDLDGSNLTSVLSDTQASGTLIWIP